jgi:acid ceramidase
VLSFTVNDRFEADGGFIGLFEWILNINRKQAWTTQLPRDVFENDKLDFNSSLKILAETPILAPVYYIIGGPNPYQVYEYELKFNSKKIN